MKTTSLGDDQEMSPTDNYDGEDNDDGDFDVDDDDDVSSSPSQLSPPSRATTTTAGAVSPASFVDPSTATSPRRLNHNDEDEYNSKWVAGVNAGKVLYLLTFLVIFSLVAE